MNSDTIVATYLIETPFSIERAAEALAGEQSTGTFLSVPGETDELKARYRARVMELVPLESLSKPSLPGSRSPTTSSENKEYHQARVTIGFPIETVGTSLSTVTATVLGNLFELSEFSGLRLLDIDFPQAFADRYSGPQFGVDGTRELSGVADRPIIGTIIKPSVGLSPEQTSHLVSELAEADIDFIKDDELMANPPHSPFENRVEAIMRVINAHADKTGKKVMYAFNLSDDIDQMLHNHDFVLKSGGTCVMVSLNSMGLPAVAKLRQHSQLPIHGHRNGWGMLTRCPALGIEFAAYQKLWRLAGVDHLHVNGLGNKFWEPDESVVKSIKACLSPMLTQPPVMPVISSGQWGGQAPETYKQTQSIDIMYLAGGGVMAHPMGPASGVRALRQAWESATLGLELSEYAKTHPELLASIETFGKRRQ